MSTDITSAALASSAVDALFLLRDSVDEVQDLFAQKNQIKVDRNERNERSVQNADDRHRQSKRSYYIDDGACGNMGLRPIHLPPLIERLVGAVEGNDLPWERRQISKDNTHRIRPDVKQVVSTKQGDVSTQKLKGDVRSVDDSIAMAAAAAAAAVWSDSARKHGRYCMKSMNDEWEGALQWISNWGQHQLDANNISQDKSRRRDRNSSRRKGGGSNRRKSSDSLNTLESNASLKACMDECLHGNAKQNLLSANKRGRRSANDELGKVDGDPVDFFSFMTTVHLRMLVKRARMSSKSLFLWLPKMKRVIKCVFSVIVSSAFFWLIRNGTGFWRLSTSRKSEKWLLDKAGCNTRKDEKARLIQQNRPTGKRLLTKKGKRKKTHPIVDRGSGLSEADSKEGGFTDHPPYTKQRDWRALDDESMGSITSYERVHSLEGEKYKLAHCHVGELSISVRQTESKGTAPLTSSPTSEATLPNEKGPLVVSQLSAEKRIFISHEHISECQKKYRSSTTNSLQTPDMWSSDTTQFHKDIAEDESLQSLPVVSINESVSCLESVENLVNHAPIAGTRMILAPPRPVERQSDSNATVYCRSISMVPTDEQREVAARQLKEFQKAQIQKLIERSQSPVAKECMYGDCPSYPHAKMLSKNVQPTSWGPAASNADSVLRQTLTNHGIRPPPGLVLFDNIKSDTAERRESTNSDDPSLGHLEGDLLLSNMLDEDDEESSADALISTSADRFQTYDNLTNSGLNSATEQKPLAPFGLGGSPVSGYSGNASAVAKIVASTTWAALFQYGSDRNTSKDGLAVTRREARPTCFNVVPVNKGTEDADVGQFDDANRCLKVSAKEFSPSWESPERRMSRDSLAPIW